jgi:hypothetical protein
VTLLVWMLGVLVLLSALESARALHDGWTTTWVVLMVLWGVLGVVVAIARLVRAALTRAGAGLLGRVPRGTVPPSKEA